MAHISSNCPFWVFYQYLPSFSTFYTTEFDGNSAKTQVLQKNVFNVNKTVGCELDSSDWG